MLLSTIPVGQISVICSLFKHIRGCEGFRALFWQLFGGGGESRYWSRPLASWFNSEFLWKSNRFILWSVLARVTAIVRSVRAELFSKSCVAILIPDIAREMKYLAETYDCKYTCFHDSTFCDTRHPFAWFRRGNGLERSLDPILHQFTARFSPWEEHQRYYIFKCKRLGKAVHRIWSW